MSPALPLLLLLDPTAATATSIEIRTGSAIEARLERTDDGPVLRGRVRTERGEPFQAALHVEMGNVTLEITTDERGLFRIAAPFATDETRVRVTLAEDTRHEAASFEASLSAAKAEVVLELRAPARASLDAPTLAFEVVGACDAGFDRKLVALRRDGRSISTGFTNDAGRAILRVGSEVLGAPGPVRLEASFAGDPVRAPAVARAETVLDVATQIEADASPRRIPVGGETRVRGRLTTRREPVAGGAVAIRIAGGSPERRVAITRTDARGEFEGVVSLGGLGPGRLALVAEYEPDAAWRRPSRSASIGIEVLRPVTVPLLAVLVPSLALLATAALLLSRLRSPRRRAWRPAPAPIVAGGAVLRRHARRTAPPADLEVTGRVWDPVARRAVGGAIVQIETPVDRREIVAASDGAFQTGPLPVGPARLAFSYPGYEPGSLSALIPHAGELRDLRFHLVPIRQRLAEVFRDAIAPLASERRWGYATPRDIARAAIARHPEAWRDGPIDRLRELVERGTWGRVDPPIADLRRAREIAAALPTRGSQP